MSGLTATRRAEEEAVAQDYARWMMQGPPRSWTDINRDIIEGWSLTALARIKTRAWEIAYAAKHPEPKP